MKAARLLVPFTHGVQTDALEQAVLLAQSRNATLIPVSLIPVSKDKQVKNLRLEHIQQSKDFLEAMKCRAAKRNVPVEQVEVLVTDIAQSIDTLARELECEGVLLFMRGKQSILLGSQELKQLIEQTKHKLYVFQMDTKNNMRLCAC